MAPNQRYIVVFKKDASQAAIDKQADDVNAHGGSVTKRHNSFIMKGFTAEIPDAYLVALQTNLQQPDSEIAYIEPDQVVTVQQI